MGKRDPDQLALSGTTSSYRPGPVERGASQDLAELRRLGKIGPALHALEVDYRRVARMIDRAEKGEELWALMKASAELRAVRAQLAPIVEATPDDDLLEQLRAALRNGAQ
jgi:hypothetical protein